MRQLKDARVVDWESEFEPRSGLAGADTDTVSSRLSALPVDCPDEEYLKLARFAVENANYSRAEAGFRVLLQSVGLLGGTRYPYMTASTDLLAALVGALSAQMPMPSHEFFGVVRQEWGFVINQESASGTTLSGQVDGAGLERNARRAEQLMSQAGLALGLSDRTTVVPTANFAWAPSVHRPQVCSKAAPIWPP